MTTDSSTTPAAARTLDDERIFVSTGTRDDHGPIVVVQSVLAEDLPADLDDAGDEFHLTPEDAETLADALRAAARHATGRPAVKAAIR